MLKNAWICFRISSSSLGNTPSIQILSFSDDRGKCDMTGDPSIEDFYTIQTSHMLSLAGSSYLPSDESYRLYLSFLCYRLSTTSWECKPNERHFFGKIFIKTRCCWERTCLSCRMPSIGIFERMLYHTSSNICDFHSSTFLYHFPIDYRLCPFSSYFFVPASE